MTAKVAHFSLLFARILRLTGVSLVAVWLLLTEYLYLWSFSNPSPEAGRFFVIGIVVAITSFALGVPLVLIGDYISPPDPWLDFWLDLKKFRKSPKLRNENESTERDRGIWATILSHNDRGRLEVKGKCLVKFEPNHLVLEQPGKDLVMMDPKKVSRTSDVTLLLDTGLLGYGRVTFTFNSASDADTVEREAAKLVEHN
jgi:hypothetical protein